MNRGSAIDPHTQESPMTGFNEAPIHESGKYCIPVRRMSPY